MAVCNECKKKFDSLYLPPFCYDCCVKLGYICDFCHNAAFTYSVLNINALTAMPYLPNNKPYINLCYNCKSNYTSHNHTENAL